MWSCPIPIEELVAHGRNARPVGERCPACRTTLAIRGGYHRRLRHDHRLLRLWVWRGYCKACNASHALFPDAVVAHHLDSNDTIYAAVTGPLVDDVPASTQRGWRARFRRNERIISSGCAAATIALGGDVTDFAYPALVAGLWLAARRRSDIIPAPSRIVNLISGMSWIGERVNSSWAVAGQFPRPP